VNAIVTARDVVLLRDAMRLCEALGLSSRDARSEVELLLTRALNITRARLIAHPELAAAAQENSTYLHSFERRLTGEPIAYILGEREFYGHTFLVSPDVLIPRPETELLVDMALARLEPHRRLKVLDLGTGSGAVAIAIALNRPNVTVVGTDTSPGALAVASMNAKGLLGDAEQGRFRLIHSDWFEQVGGTQFDLIVSNPPYVAEGDPHLAEGDIRFEPGQALVSGPRGLDALEQIITAAPRCLAQGGWLLCEHGYDQADAVRRLLIRASISERVSERDLAGMPRVSGGRWLTGPAGGG
jgi:release factor glutamine methyltransferase